jgi:hypothetical protein
MDMQAYMEKGDNDPFSHDPVMKELLFSKRASLCYTPAEPAVCSILTHKLIAFMFSLFIVKPYM